MATTQTNHQPKTSFLEMALSGITHNERKPVLGVCARGHEHWVPADQASSDNPFVPVCSVCGDPLHELAPEWAV